MMAVALASVHMTFAAATDLVLAARMRTGVVLQGAA